MRILGKASDPRVRAKLQQLTKFVAEFKRATRQKDAQALSRTVADEFTLIDPTGNVIDKQQMLRDITSGRISFKSYQLRQETLAFHGDTAIGIDSFTMAGSLKQATKSGKVVDLEIDGKYRQTNTYVKKGTRWVLAACHLTHL